MDATDTSAIEIILMIIMITMFVSCNHLSHIREVERIEQSEQPTSWSQDIPSFEMDTTFTPFREQTFTITSDNEILLILHMELATTEDIKNYLLISNAIMTQQLDHEDIKWLITNFFPYY